MSAFVSSSGHTSARAFSSFVPTADICSAANEVLFDHLVGGGEQCGRNFKPERLRGLYVDGELESRRLFERQVGGLRAFENESNVVATFVIAVAKHRSVAYESTGFHKLTKFIKRRDCVSCCERNKVLTSAGEE